MRQGLAGAERRTGEAPVRRIARIGGVAALCLIQAVAWVIPAAAGQAPTVARILAANRVAMHGTVGTGTLELDYAFSGLGLTGSTSRTVDLATGAFVETSVSGPISLGSGYDGRVPWMRDFSGAANGSPPSCLPGRR